ncbi:hypothetical protein KGQ64_04730 [bacterium]|nr:hypothetical protein [bacterium]
MAPGRPPRDGGKPKGPVRLSESQYDRLVDFEALFCLRCSAIGPYDEHCEDGEGHQLVTIVDAEASGLVEVDFPEE